LLVAAIGVTKNDGDGSRRKIAAVVRSLGRRSFPGSHFLTKGGEAVQYITFDELLKFVLVLIALVDLFLCIAKYKKN